MLKDSVTYALRIATRMTSDPEALSIANAAAFRAERTFDPSYGVPKKRWIARCVKQDIWCYWRKLKVRREEQKDEAWWSEVMRTIPSGKRKRGAKQIGERAMEELVSCDEELELNISRNDWLLLWERFVDRIPLDVIGRRRGTTRYGARRMVAAAVARLKSSLE